MSNRNNDSKRNFSYEDSVLYNGALYPTTHAYMDDGSGIARDSMMFADANGQYYTMDDKGKAYPVMLQHELPEVEVTPSQEEMLANAFGRYLTMSNDKTRVSNVPHREYNPHLRESALRGAREHALWDKEHPNLAAWRDFTTAVPFGVAAAPVAMGLGDMIVSSSIGNIIRSNITGPIVDAALKNSQILPWIDAATASYFGADGINDIKNGKFTPETVMKVAPLVTPSTSIAEQAAKEAWYSKWAQYPRYYTGKLYYGKDAELPTLYRKLNGLPIVENNNIILTNPNSRFAYKDGISSPTITNMTTDVPVRSHGAGNWDLADVLAFPGKTLLGKNVVSTRPSDTFTFGDKISVSPSKVTFFSGSDDAVSAAQNLGMEAKVSEDSKRILDAFNKAEEESMNPFNFNKIDGEGYAKGIQRLVRNTFKSPTVKDYKFMDWVFQPKYKSEVIPFKDLSNINFKDFLTLPKQISIQFGDARLRNYLLNPEEWKNVIYDPATPVESMFRGQKGIDLKKNIHN